MKWSFKIARIAGIDVRIHSTFLLLIAWIGFSYWISQKSIVAVLNGILFILLLFFFVILHEFGHALAARKFGIATKDITLLPIGGVARIEKMPKEPRQELRVALAGPLVNLVLAVILFFWLFISNGLPSISQLSLTGGSLLERLAFVNLSLFLFNLIPAFPMDGGRVLRALLATKMDYARATQTAATFGQGFALIFGIIGLFSNPFFLFIALFVWIGAGQESSSVQIKESIGGIPVRQAMVTNFQTLSPTQRISDAITAILSGYQQDFPILNGDQMVGILTRPAIMQAIAREGATINIASVMEKNFVSVNSDEMLDVVMGKLQTCGCTSVPVFENGALIGLITMENMGEFLMIQSAMKRAKPNN
ncbi:MAG: site-2 protease family protein [Chloroflexi bacterium HGW-Chloroflexi-8]|nr:MAG: site-2 protease family protein [Chloroflexi bacterium HGW-Chloroflexi-8]